MKNAQKLKEPDMVIIDTPVIEGNMLEKAIAQSWSKIAPFWPLKNLIAVNPLSGFEDLPFEKALHQGQVYFQQDDLPSSMLAVNRESIKWLQAYFDNGQSTISMPGRNKGLLHSVLKLLPFDGASDKNGRVWLKNLPDTPHAIIAECLLHLGIAKDDYAAFLTLLLTTLPGWAGHVQYRANWSDTQDQNHAHPVTQKDYLALRLVLTCLLWPDARALLDWHKAAMKNTDVRSVLSNIEQHEKKYRTALLEKLLQPEKPAAQQADAQLVFCIDVRSEPFRRALEAQGAYETYGFAGFFGVPVSIENEISGESYHSCPVLLKPSHHVKEIPSCGHEACQSGHKRQQGLKQLYQSLKYNFTTTFALVETLGPASGVWMGLRSLAPRLASTLKAKTAAMINPAFDIQTSIESIPFESQCSFAAGALKTMGLIDNFAPLVVFCGHGSTTQNNAYATALDCGACGGRHGAPNARILAGILNKADVRKVLAKYGITIPASTHFLAAEHNTTTDAVEIFDRDMPEVHVAALEKLQVDLGGARAINTLWRCGELEAKSSNTSKHAALRSQDWAQVRPEWGLARNAAFIVGPRNMTKNVDLEGRSFLHSYEWEKDADGSALTTILTAPMVVAQWINSQYLFSTLDNVVYGGGSKITKNVTGKIGIMQGNASDLMNGLPLQSVYSSDGQAYHQPMRLMTIVYAPRDFIERIVKEQDVLQKLFGNGWVTLVCFDPELNQRFILQRDLSWVKVQ